MQILEYNDVDPLKVFILNQLALDFPLSPELVAYIRKFDPRPFPCLAIYAVEGDLVLGQVGLFRLPMVSTEGREDVGGIWAVSTHPQYASRGVASLLMEAAHARMRAAGLRFSTLSTNRYRVAHNLYRRFGYADTHVWAAALAPWGTAHQPTRLRARPAGPDAHALVEQLYPEIAGEYLGFAWRHTPFARLRRSVKPADIWLLQANGRAIGYALASADETLLTITDLVLQPGIDAAEAVAAVAAELRAPYVQVTVSRPVEIASLQRAGFQVAQPTWDAFMLKPLVPEVTVEDARRLFGLGTDRFLISWLDVT